MVLESVIPKQKKIGPSVIIDNDKIADNNDCGMTTDDTAKWILYAIGKEYEEAFTFVAKKLGMPVHGDKFSPRIPSHVQGCKYWRLWSKNVA